MDQSRMPLIEALIAYHEESVVPFDVPGHKHGKGLKAFDEFLRRYGLELDVNSMKSLDILSNPTSVIKEAEELLALAYGADYSFFMVAGTTSSVQAMMMSSLNPGDKVILPRNAHKSAINGLILSGAIPVYIQPEIDKKLGIAMGVSYEKVLEAIEHNPDAKALLVINPTYYGATCDLDRIVQLAHGHDMVVMADEAHGAHLHFHEDLPKSAMAAGCDMAAVSLHKTGGSLTQSSALLMRKNPFVDVHHVRNTINLTLSSSASYLLMASIEFARKELATRGGEIFEDLLELVRKYRNKINEIPGVYAIGRELIDGAGVFDFDETKLTINVSELKLNGYEVYDMLREQYQIQAELADVNNVLFIISLGDDEEALERLLQAIKEIGETYQGGALVPFERILDNPEVIVSPREAYYAGMKTVALVDSLNGISGESVMVYPPGIPIVTPGERISQEMIDYIEFLKTQETVITGPEDPSVESIKILGI